MMQGLPRAGHCAVIMYMQATGIDWWEPVFASEHGSFVSAQLLKTMI
jgi:hypothetical protein